MAASTSATTEEATSVYTGNKDPEINATSSKQNGMIATQVNVNRVQGQIPLNVTATSSVNASQKLSQEISKDTEDAKSIRGLFGWKSIRDDLQPVLFIIRIVDGVAHEFVSVRVAETHLLNSHLQFLHPDLYTFCTSVIGHFMTKSEAKLLNEINQTHSDKLYGKAFVAGKDCLVRFEDLQEFYTFIEECLKKLNNNFSPGLEGKCGFIHINSESVIPYFIKEGQKYVPLFYFEYESDNLKFRNIKLENWDLAYLKFCCKVQGIRNELFDSDSCIVTHLDDIKSYFPSDTDFKEYTPPRLINQCLLINKESSHVYRPGCWIKTCILSKEPVSENIVQQPPLPSQSIVPPQSMSLPMDLNSFPKERPTNQKNLAVFPQSSSNSVSSQRPPVLQMGIPTTQIVSNNTELCPNVASVNVKSVITKRNSMPHGSNMMKSQNIGQVQYHQQKPLQQYRGPSPMTRGGMISKARLPNMQQRNVVRPTTITQSSEIIDLTSPPSSPNPLSESLPSTSLGNTTQAYKIRKAQLNGKTIHCINVKPFMYYSDLMVTLHDLVQVVHPTSSISLFAHVLHKYFNLRLFKGNDRQVAELRRNGYIGQHYVEGIPLLMVMLNDINRILRRLLSIVLHLEQTQQSQQSKVLPAKRHSTG